MVSAASSFQSALEVGDLAAVRACPKADLHTHGGLGANRAGVMTAADLDQVRLNGLSDRA